MERRSRGWSLPGLGHPSGSVLFSFLQSEALSEKRQSERAGGDFSLQLGWVPACPVLTARRVVGVEDQEPPLSPLLSAERSFDVRRW